MSSSVARQHLSSPSVLFVCTGNVCRSPFAEHLLRAHLPELSVTSRGIFALSGSPMEAHMAQELAFQHISATGFRAAQVTMDDLNAELVLTASQRQRRFLLDEHPSVARRCGLLGHIPELATQVASAPGDTFSNHVATWTRAALPAGRDIPDPYGKGPEEAARSAQLIRKLIEQLVPLLSNTISNDARNLQ